MKKLSIIAFCLVAVGLIAAPILTPTKIIGNTTSTAARVVWSSPCKLFCVLGYNAATNTQYVFVFESKAAPTNSTNGRLGPFPVGASSYYSLDLSAYGADMDCVTVGISSTATTFTLAPTNTSTIQAIISQNQ